MNTVFLGLVKDVRVNSHWTIRSSGSLIDSGLLIILMVVNLNAQLMASHQSSKSKQNRGIRQLEIWLTPSFGLMQVIHSSMCLVITNKLT